MAESELSWRSRLHWIRCHTQRGLPPPACTVHAAVITYDRWQPSVEPQRMLVNVAATAVERFMQPGVTRNNSLCLLWFVSVGTTYAGEIRQASRTMYNDDRWR